MATFFAPLEDFQKLGFENADVLKFYAAILSHVSIFILHFVVNSQAKEAHGVTVFGVFKNRFFEEEAVAAEIIFRVNGVLFLHSVIILSYFYQKFTYHRAEDAERR